MTARVVSLLCVLVGVAAAVDPALDTKCQEWVISNQKDLVFLNQVAGQGHIASCQPFCMVAGSGMRSDTTTCRSLCEQAGGYKSFAAALSKEGGMASPSDICRSMLTVVDEPMEAVSLLEVGQSDRVERKLGVRGDMTIQGTLSTSMLSSPIGDVKVSGELNVMNQIESHTARAAYLKADSGVSIKSGIKSKKSQLLIKGKIDADSVTMDGLQASSFLEVNGIRQWSLVSLEDFEESEADGWSNGALTECGGRKLLGGHCVQNGAEVTKTFTGLPPHSSIRVNAKYMFIDSWDGESGFLKMNNNVVWTETYNHADGSDKHGIDMCGNSTPEKKWGRPIDVTIPHTEDSITLTFGATTDEHPCDESFAVDSVMVFVR